MVISPIRSLPRLRLSLPSPVSISLVESTYLHIKGISEPWACVCVGGGAPIISFPAQNGERELFSKEPIPVLSLAVARKAW